MYFIYAWYVVLSISGSVATQYSDNDNETHIPCCVMSNDGRPDNPTPYTPYAAIQKYLLKYTTYDDYDYDYKVLSG